MIPFIEEKSAFFVTNAVSHGLRLVERGFRAAVLGGEIKASTEAVVGNEAYLSLKKYHFTKGFWGTNGVSRISGFTTPDPNEALIKEFAMERTREPMCSATPANFSRPAPSASANFPLPRLSRIAFPRKATGERTIL